jgi:hypothetical protein
MSSNNSEYNNNIVGYSGCSYSSLCALGSNSTMAPLPIGSVQGMYPTPNYRAITYDALTGGKVGSCTRYFNIQDAYGAGSDNCGTQYTNRSCSSGCDVGPGEGPGAASGWQCMPGTSGASGTCVQSGFMGDANTYDKSTCSSLAANNCSESYRRRY